MLYALAHPAALLVLVVSFVVGVGLHGWVGAAVAFAVRDRRPRLSGRLTPDPRPHLEPFGVLAGAISGLGWSKPIDLPDRRRRAAVVLVALSGPLANIAIGIGLLALVRVAHGGPGRGLAATFFSPSFLLQHGLSLTGAAGVTGATALYLAGCSQLYLGALSLVPLPPLDGGRLLFALGPRTHGWQQAEYQLVERNFGVAALLVLLVVPLGGGQTLLPRLLDIVLAPLVTGVAGG